MRRPEDQPDLVQSEPRFWEKLTGLFDRSSDAVIVNRRAPPPEPPQPTPAPWPETEPAHTAVPMSPPEPPEPPPPPEPKAHFGDDFLIGAWKQNNSASYEGRAGGAIGAAEALANSPVGDWIYKNLIKSKPRRR